jgi:hypothetical protein
MNQNIKTFRLLPFVPLPATMIGVYTMRYFEVPTQIWLLNLSFVCVCTLLVMLFSKKIVQVKNSNPYLILGISTLFLLGTFYGNGVLNVHRWINLKSFQVNIGLIVSPLILIQIAKITNQIYAVFFTVLTTSIFLLQPDASLVTAFSVAVFFLFLNKKSNLILIPILLFLSVEIVFAWYNLDNLQPVSYVEGIIKLTKEISIVLIVASLISLCLLILPFINFQSKNHELSISLAIYYAALLITSFVGNFPVMIMGYGFAPIVGYYIGLIWQIDHQK